MTTKYLVAFNCLSKKLVCEKTGKKFNIFSIMPVFNTEIEAKEFRDSMDATIKAKHPSAIASFDCSLGEPKDVITS